MLEIVPVLDFRRCPCGGGARRPREDMPSCSSGLFSRNTVEVAQRIEPEEIADRVGEGGGCKEDASDVWEAGELGISREFRVFLRIGVGRERKPWASAGELAWPRGEGGKDELSGDETGEVSIEGPEALSSCTPTTEI